MKNWVNIVRFQLLFAAMGCLLLGAAALPAAEVARGTVFEDRNGNGKRDAGERGLANVRVSNQRDIVRTDRRGRWELPVLAEGDTTFFVVKPRDFMPPVSLDQLPRFSYQHKPAGSPTLTYKGVSATGPLPVQIDFPLLPAPEPETFEAIFFGDTQPRDLREVDYFKQDIVEELIGPKRARFGVTLGDIVFDDLSVMEPHNAAVAMIGLPWWNVIGNHDVNADAPTRADFDDTYNRIYGPSYFSFDHGPVHFVALNNIRWIAPEDRGTNRATWLPAVGEDQLAWLAKDLALVPEEQLVVLMMHVPLNDMADATNVYRLIERRRYVFSISGHTHYHEHRILTKADGWRGVEPHRHVVNVTACGSWWTGQPDEFGIPHTTMRDGAPNGYTILTFKDRSVTVDFKASRRPPEYQMNILTPETITQSAVKNTPLYVNVFNGSSESLVRYRLNDLGPWVELTKVREPDPIYVAAYEREPAKPAAPYRRMSAPMASPHLWKGALPANLPAGTHEIRVQATDGNGKWHTAARVLTVK